MSNFAWLILSILRAMTIVMLFFIGLLSLMAATAGLVWLSLMVWP